MNLSSIKSLRPIPVATHPRSGTHLTIDFIRRHFASARRRLRPLETPHNLYVSLDRLMVGHHRPMDPDAFVTQLARSPRTLIKTHALPEFDNLRPECRPLLDAILTPTTVIYTVRDGRAVMCSWQAYERTRCHAARESFSAFIRSEGWGFDDRPTSWATHAQRWSERDSTNLFTFEQIVREPEASLNAIAELLGERPDTRHPLLPPRLGSKWKIRWARLIGRTDSTTLPGPPGPRAMKWTDAFASRDDRDFFDDRAGQTLLRFGYEPDRSWVEAGATAATGVPKPPAPDPR